MAVWTVRTCGRTRRADCSERTALCATGLGTWQVEQLTGSRTHPSAHATLTGTWSGSSRQEAHGGIASSTVERVDGLEGGEGVGREWGVGAFDSWCDGE